MAAPATPVKKRGRGPIRLIVVLAVLVLIVGGLLFSLNLAASAATSVGATLTVLVPPVSVQRARGGFATPTSRNPRQAGDSGATDLQGPGPIRFPYRAHTRT